MIGIRWPRSPARKLHKEDLKLAFFEVKYGDGSLANPNGLLKHFNDIAKYLLNAQLLQELSDEMKNVFNQKVRLGLFHSSVLIDEGFSKIKSISHEQAELIFLIANHQPASTVLKRELLEICKTEEYKKLNEHYEMKVATSSPIGYGLYEKNMIPISEYIGIL